MDESLTAYLLAHAGLTALVSNRVQWDVRPQASALPAVTLSDAGSVPTYSMSGDSELYATRVQVDAWGSTRASARAVARQVFVRLNAARFTQNGVSFFATFTEPGESSYEQTTASVGIYRKRQDFILWHTA